MAVLAASVLAGVVAPPASAEEIRFSAQPGSAAGPDGRTRFSYQVEPGQSVSDYLVIRNDAATPLAFDVYAADASNDPEGAFLVGLADEAAPGAASWVSIDGVTAAGGTPARATRTVEAGGSLVVPFTLAVPADAAPGDHAAGMVVALGGADGTVQVDRRLATRLYARVAGPLQPAISVGGLQADYTAELNPFTGSIDVVTTLVNTGNVALRGTLSVWGTAFWGAQISGAMPTEVTELLPGATREMAVSVPGVGQIGPVTVNVRLDPYVGPESPDPGPLAATNREEIVWATPWAALLAAVIAIAIAALLLWRARRRARRHAAELAWARDEGARTAQSTDAAASAAAELTMNGAPR